MDTKKLFEDFSNLVESMSVDNIIKNIEDATRHTENSYILDEDGDSTANSPSGFPM